MKNMKKCLNEWNPIVEALGQGKQTILIRKYETTINKFILYPTLSYTFRSNYLDNFDKKYKPFVKENVLPKKDNNKTEVKYFATVEKIIESPSEIINSLNKYHIWTNEHVNSFLKRKKAYIWILRIYTLKIPIFTEKTKGIRFANLIEEVSLEGINPVLNNLQFFRVLEDIDKKILDLKLELLMEF